jgi:hypothetical protein
METMKYSTAIPLYHEEETFPERIWPTTQDQTLAPTEQVPPWPAK